MVAWTEEMLRTLTEEYPDKLNAEIAQRLGVTKAVVEHKARELGLRKPPDFNERHRKAIYARRTVPYRNDGWFRKGTRTGEESRFRKGHTESEEGKAGRITSVTKARRKQTYDELVRIKYGLRRRTRLRLPRKVFYINKEKYIDDDK